MSKTMAIPNAEDSVRERVREKISKIAEQFEFEEKFNVLVVGTVGSGKSSLINSIEQAVTGRQANIAKVGRGAGENVTLCLQECKMFSTSEASEGLKDKISFWDYVGLPDRNDETIKALISLALDGHIPENQPLTNPDYYEMYEEELEDEFAASYGGQKIHRVVFVCAADEEVHTNLLQATKTAVHPHTTASDRNIPLFLFMSKEDRMAATANAQDLNRRVQSAKDTLNATNDFFERGTLYHEQSDQNMGDDVMASNEANDGPLLRLLDKMLNPQLRLVHTGPRLEPTLNERRRRWQRKKYIRTQRWMRKNLWETVALFALIVLASVITMGPVGIAIFVGALVLVLLFVKSNF